MKRYMVIMFNDQGIITRTCNDKLDIARAINRAHDIGLQAQVYELKLIDDEYPEAGLKYVFVE